jgi:hypothetical protein
LVVGVPGPAGMLDEVVVELAGRHARRWAGQYVQDPALLREEIVALLVRMGLMARSAPTVADLEPAQDVPAGIAERAVDARGARGGAPDGTLVLLAAAARYAPAEVVR